MLRLITEDVEANELVERERDEYILASSRAGIGTIVLCRGFVVAYEWAEREKFVDFAKAYVDNEEIDEMVDFDFSHVEVKFIYSYDNYVKFLEDRGVTIND
ncbi:hypothetical protein BCPG3_106 [Bacillus phage BCPG3]|uniref:Uncharacterized protein n=2 Tax=Wphvirus TaxID=1922327 RepID=W5QUJ0_9CAUD|nr:hypothetical protein BPS13_0109 [Bacillus phage BPS13]YP_009002997.1 hypothetical protein BPS10C_111 [Bacillus phage BPS10C]AEZ50288.1 hypothetical protein BPS13_0109 [Bacillus phage BPS13]AGI12108.1 hypothetical protein BPS10C_111 [Bacillus phage BPS10C]QSJ04423.1 hypothetical protein BCPG3_106 [Bacillus phage BCPG3]